MLVVILFYLVHPYISSFTTAQPSRQPCTVYIPRPCAVFNPPLNPRPTTAHCCIVAQRRNARIILLTREISPQMKNARKRNETQYTQLGYCVQIYLYMYILLPVFCVYDIKSSSSLFNICAAHLLIRVYALYATCAWL